MPIYDYEYNGKIYSVQSDTQPNDDEVMSFIQSYKEPAPKPQPQKKVASQPSLPPVQETGQTDTPVLEGGISQTANWDSKGNVYYTDENGNRIENKQPLTQKIGNWAKKTATNVGDFLNYTAKTENPFDDPVYRDKAKLATMIATAPAGAIASSATGLSGLGSLALGGGVDGGIYGLAEGLIDRKTPLDTAINTGLYATGGSLLGLGSGLAGRYAPKVVQGIANKFKKKPAPVQEAVTEVAEEVAPSQFGVTNIDSSLNKNIAQQINDRVQAEQELLSEYKNFHANLNKKYGSIEKLKAQAVQDMPMNAQYGMKSDAIKDYQNLIAYENLLAEARYVNNSFRRAANGAKVVNENAIQNSVRAKKLKAQKQEGLKNDENVLQYNQELLNEQRTNTRNIETNEITRGKNGTLRQDSRTVPEYDSEGSNATRLFVRGNDNLWVINPKSTNEFNTDKVSKISYRELPQDINSGNSFYDAISQAKKEFGDLGAQVHTYTPEEYSQMRLFLSEDGLSGCAVKSDGDIVSVFSNPNVKIKDFRSRSHAMVELTIQNGGNKLDAFDTYLPDLYKKHGFKEVGRDKWNEQYKPEGWNKEFFKKWHKNGEPDVVYMQLEEAAPAQVYPFEKPLPRESVTKTSRLGQSDYVVDTLGRKVKVDYDTLPNAELIDMAEREVAKDPVSVLTDLLSRGADEKTNFSGLDIEKARQLLPKLYNEGRVDDAINLTEVLSRKGTEAGRAVQAMSLWSKTTPEGAEVYAQRVIDKYNDKHPKKPITLSPEQRAKIRELAANIQKFEEGTYERNRATAIMLKEIAQTVPTSAADKFRTLRNISLLLNPKTFARNISGNATLGGVENTATKNLAAGLDKIVSLGTGKRSRVATQGADYITGLIEGFKRGNKEVLEGINTRNLGARFDLPNTRVFKAPVLKQLEVATDWSLRVPDSAFYQATFEESLRNQIKTAMINKGVKPTKITPEIMKEYMNSKMVKQATEEALESVFQNNGILSNGLTGIRRLLRGNGDFGIGDVLIPYAQTPANVAEMGLNYSPLGLLKGVGNLAKGNQRQATLDLARGLIGTGIGGVGYGLAKEGLAYAEGGKPQEKLNAELLGQKPYTMRIGDNYYSYNQIQPLGSPFAAGVAMGNKATPLESLDSYMGSILDTSMLRGINQLRTDVERYGPGVAGLNAILGLPSQLIPTSLNQVNAYVDPIQRETYDPNPIQRTLNYAEAKIPVLSKNLPARYNLKGEEKKKYESEGIEKAFDVFLNPIFKSKAKDDLVARELIELNKSTGENVLLPIASKKITKKDNLKLSGKQYSEYQKVLGEKTYEGLNELINSNLYANADDNTRADLVQQRQKIIRAFVDEQLFGTENQYKPKAKDPVKKLENKVNNFNKKINKLKTMQILYDDLGIADVESILEEE